MWRSLEGHLSVYHSSCLSLNTYRATNIEAEIKYKSNWQIISWLFFKCCYIQLSGKVIWKENFFIPTILDKIRCLQKKNSSVWFQSVFTFSHHFTSCLRKILIWNYYRMKTKNWNLPTTSNYVTPSLLSVHLDRCMRRQAGWSCPPLGFNQSLKIHTESMTK